MSAHLFQHLGWPHLPRLAKQLIVVEAALDAPRDLAAKMSDPTFRTMLNEAISANPSLVSEEGKAILDSYLIRAEAGLESNHPRSSVVGDALEFRTLLTEQLSSTPCARCSPATPCSGKDRLSDDETVARRGVCIQPLRNVFDFAREVAQAVFSEVHRSCALHFRTAPLHDSGQDDVFNLAVSAVTDEETPELRHAILQVSAKEFELSDYLATLYILFHECFCHGLYGIPLKSTAAGKSDPFSEGWMDWVGLQVLTNALETTKGTQWWGRRAFEFREKACQVQRMRVDCSSRRANPLACKYAVGARAAQRFVVLLEGTTGNRSVARHLLTVFSAAVSASDRPDTYRAELVAAVSKLLARVLDVRSAVQNVRPDVRLAFEDYVKNSTNLHANVQLSDRLLDISMAY